jgi:hypothetical protein
VVASIVVSVSTTAMAQPLFGDPLAEANAYRSERGALPEARYRARYEVTTKTGRKVPALTEVVMDVASDWSLTR